MPPCSLTYENKNSYSIMNTIKLNTIGERPIKKGAGGGGNYVYYDTSSIPMEDERMQMLLQISYSVKEVMLNGLMVFSTNAMRVDVANPIIAVGIDPNLKLSVADSSGEIPAKTLSLGEMIAEYASWILDLPSLTEEEFYKIPPQFTVRYSGMSVEPTTYSYDEGMTWREWCDSVYNTLGYTIGVDDSEVIGVVPGFGGTGSVRYNTPDERYTSRPDDLIESREYYLNLVG